MYCFCFVFFSVFCLFCFLFFGVFFAFFFWHSYIIIILSGHQHEYPWPSLPTPPYCSSLPVGPQGYTPYPHRAAVCRFELVALFLLCPVCWGCRIHWLQLCRGVSECIGYDTKQSDGEVPVMLGPWGIRSTPSLPLLPGPHWPEVVAPDRALSMC